jgi:hypothetical protein
MCMMSESCQHERGITTAWATQQRLSRQEDQNLGSARMAREQTRITWSVQDNIACGHR